MFHRRRVQGITKKLYKLQPVDQDSLVTRKLKGQINSLKSASIRAQRHTQSQSFSSIRNLSVELLNDMFRARRRKEQTISIMEEESPVANSSKDVIPDINRVRLTKIRPSILDMKALSQQMSPLLHRTEVALQEEEEKPAKMLSSSFIHRREVSSGHGNKPHDPAEMKREMARIGKRSLELDRKTKLYVTSIALLEDELRELVADCLEFKRSLIRKKLDCAYRELRQVKHEQTVLQSQRQHLARELKQLASMPVTPFCLD